MRKYYYSLFLSWISRDNEKTKLSETHCLFTVFLSPVPCFLSLYAITGDKGLSENIFPDS